MDARSARTLIINSPYDPERVEEPQWRRWVEEGWFVANADAPGEPYCIILPPPNVTGALHMGHALNGTLQDTLIRFHRMQGRNVLWQPGLDHAGIATQTVVERQLAAEGLSRHDLGREAFLARVWAWKEESGGRIIEQYQRIGASCDWSRLKFTMDESSSRAVVEAFVRLWEAGLIYRGERLVNWDPDSGTALSDLEVDHIERDGEMYRFAYPLADGSGEIVVATTRPETMLGDTGVAVHPDDERYRAYKGKLLRHPFFPERELRVVADDHVDPEFGTGAVKITPAHDPNDFAIGLRHGLKQINIFTPEAKINAAGGPFAGLDRYEARAAVKAELARLGLERGSEPIRHAVTVSQRSGAVIEPMLSRQYFVRMEAMAKAALERMQTEAKPAFGAHDNHTQLIPEGWLNTWVHFLSNIQDWCVSRQLWWGHRIPVYYDLHALPDAIARFAPQSEAAAALARGVPLREVLKIALATLDEAGIEAIATASRHDLAAAEPERYVQEEDVLDTWFSSGLWPLSTLGWPDSTPDLKTWYPSTVLVTAFDILFFWVARMMMLGLAMTDRETRPERGTIPFRHVVLHAIVRDEHGEKMSKTKGNVIDPLDVVAEHGADALRFTLVAMTSLGRDIRLSPKRVEGYRHFCNKLWNAVRFVLTNVEQPVNVPDPARGPEHPFNRWILDRIATAADQATRALEEYRFADYAQIVYQAAWNDLCDWYLEGAKVLLRADDEVLGQETRQTLVAATEAVLRLIHPAMPFVTEALAAALPLSDNDTAQPVAKRAFRARFLPAQPNSETARAVSELIAMVEAVRNIRGENGISPNQPVDIVVQRSSTSAWNDMHTVTALTPLLRGLGRIRAIAAAETEPPPSFSATAVGEGFQVWVPLAGLVDVDAELARLTKAREKLAKELAQVERKLGNAQFRSQAPADVVAEQERKQQEIRDALIRTEAHLARIKTAHSGG